MLLRRKRQEQRNREPSHRCAAATKKRMKNE
jgi:hypothetical protein